MDKAVDEYIKKQKSPQKESADSYNASSSQHSQP